MGRYLRKGFSLANLLEVLTRVEKEGELAPKTCENQNKTEGCHRELPSCFSALHSMLKFKYGERGQGSVPEKNIATSFVMSGDKQAGLQSPSVQ